MIEGAILICQASIEFPPFSMLSFIKNGQTLSSSINGSLQIDTRGVDTNVFGLYTCQLNVSGVILQKSYVLKEQGTYVFFLLLRVHVSMAASLEVTLSIKCSNICSNSVSFVHVYLIRG